jgi:hypothetical protein
MDTFIVPMTFPDLDTAKRDAGTLVDALRTAGVHAELADGPGPGSDDDAGRPDPGPTTRELHVRAASAAHARERVQEVVDGQLPAGVVLLGEATRVES